MPELTAAQPKRVMIMPDPQGSVVLATTKSRVPQLMQGEGEIQQDMPPELN